MAVTPPSPSDYSRWSPLGDGESYAGPELREWQTRALEAWEASDHRGVVEAVTGTGKSLVGVAAIHEVLSLGGVALVMVPTLALVEQWVANLRAQLPEARIGALSGLEKTDFRNSNVIVATVQTLSRRALPGTSLTLIVADEVHRYGSERFGNALSEQYQWRLGLTGTYERSGDDGKQQVLDPYFGGTILDYSYGEALADGVVAPFDLAFIGVHFEPTEQAEYSVADENVKDATYKLKKFYGYPDPWSDFFASVTRNLATDHYDDELKLCRQYMSGFSDRKKILAAAQGKLAVVEKIGPFLEQRSGTLLFAEGKDAARRHAFVLSKSTTAFPLDGESKQLERSSKLRDFEAGRLKVIATPKIFDEGMDVHGAEVAIVVAASQSRRQMIQRMGRVIRLKDDGSHARMVMLYVVGTPEDPNRGGHEAFLDSIVPHARNIDYFDPDQFSNLKKWFVGA